MECPCRWAAIIAVTFFIIQVTDVYCQNYGNTQNEMKDVKRDVSNLFNPSTKTIGDKTFLTNVYDDRAKTFNVISQVPSYYSQDPTLFGYSPASGNNLNMAITPPYATLPELASCNGKISLDNYANINQQSPIWLVSQPTMDLYNRPIDIQINTPSNLFPSIKTQPGISEFLSETFWEGLLQEPEMLKTGYEDGIPVNLQINVPSQNLPAPRITVVSTAPAPVTTANSEAALPFPQFGFPLPPLPIVKKKSRSWKSLLPIILLALLSDQDGCGNGCCCPCNCSRNDSPIPIPYPIPIPVNSPIINNRRCSYSSRKRGHRDNEDDDDEDK